MRHALWRFLDLFTDRRHAIWAIGTGVLLAAIGFAFILQLKIGGTGSGAPELRADSRYNRDNAFMVENYRASSDTM